MRSSFSTTSGNMYRYLSDQIELKVVIPDCTNRLRVQNTKFVSCFQSLQITLRKKKKPLCVEEKKRSYRQD